MPWPETFELAAEAAVVENHKIISPAHITIEKGLITKISSCTTSHRTKVIPLPQHLLLPGFTNAHCHLELTGIGSLSPNTFFKWVKDLIIKKSALRETDFTKAIRQGAQTLAQSGVTTVIDHVSPTTDSSAYDDLPVRVIAFGEWAGLTEKILSDNLEKLETEQKKSSVPYHISPHSIYAFEPKRLKQFLTERQGPLSLHIAESDDEKNYFKNSLGDLFERIFAITGHKPHGTDSAFEFLKNTTNNLSQMLLVHGNDLTTIQLNEIQKQKNICIVHCPGSFDYFGHRNFPLAEILSRKIPLALGTDSLASNFSFNFLDEINRFLKKYPNVDFFGLLPMLTTNALEAIGIQDRGQIREGMAADIIGLKFSAQLEPNSIFAGQMKVDFGMSGGSLSTNPYSICFHNP